MRNKRFFIRAAVLMLILASVLSFAACAPADNAVVNGGFESELSPNNLPPDWKFYNQDIDAATDTTFENYKSKPTPVDFDDTGADGQSAVHELIGDRYMRITNSASSYGYLTQKVNLAQGKVYKLSVYIKIDSVITGAGTSKRGAHVGFLEDMSFSLGDLSVTGGWKEYTKYITVATGKSLTLYVGVGDKDHMASGTALFDNVTIAEADEAALTADERSGIVSIKYTDDSYDFNDGGSIAFTVVLSLLSVAVFILLYYFIRKNLGKNEDGGTPSPAPTKGMKGGKNSKESVTAVKPAEKNALKTAAPLLIFLGVMLGAFLVRLIFVLTLGSGYGQTMTALIDTANALTTYTPPGFFSSYSSSMPYGMLYVLWILDGISNAAGISSTFGMSVMLRLPMIIADIVTCYMIYSIASKYYGSKVGAIFAALFAVVPFAFTASSVWAMTAMVAVPFIFGAFISALNKKYIAATALFTVGVMFEYYLVLLAPLFIAYMIYFFVKENKVNRIKIGAANGAAILLFFLLSLPFTVNLSQNGSIFYIATQMWQYFARVTALSDNTFSFYTMIGMTGNAMNQAMYILNIIFILVVIAVAVYLYVASYNRLNLLLASSFVFIFLSVIGAQSTVALFTLGVLLLFLYVVMAGERRMYKMLAAYSTMLFLNLAMLAGLSGSIGGHPTAAYVAFPALSALNVILSLVNVLLTAYFTYLVVRVTAYDDARDLKPLTGSWHKDLLNGYRTTRGRLQIIFSKKGDKK